MKSVLVLFDFETRDWFVESVHGPSNSKRRILFIKTVHALSNSKKRDCFL